VSRPLRAMFVANDGFSAGHVTRALAIAAALTERGRARGVEVASLLATTSEADALFGGADVALLRLPAPDAARRAGLADPERRRLVRACLEAAVQSFGPDLVVVDTFPSGPHGELAGALEGHARRVLVRRHVPVERWTAEPLAAGLAACALAIVADDPTQTTPVPGVNCVHVPPIVRAHELASREAARARLGLPRDARVLLVTSGGGGDGAARERAARFASAARKHDPGSVVAVAAGPLATLAMDGVLLPRGLVPLRCAPLGPWMAAFDGAIAAAGYNTAHELAHAGVPAVLYACPRPFDDQAARARRFAEQGLAFALEDDAGLPAALAWLRAPRPDRACALRADGAPRAADALLDLAGARSA